MIVNWLETVKRSVASNGGGPARRRRVQPAIVAVEVELLEPRTMLSATSAALVVDNFVESDASPSQPSAAAQVLHARLSNLVAAFEARLHSIGESFESHLGGAQWGTTSDIAPPQFLERAASQGVTGCGCAPLTAAHPGLESVIEEQPLFGRLAQTEQVASVTGYGADPASPLKPSLVDFASGLSAQQKSLSSASLSGEQLLASILADIGERLDIDFGPGDGTGCGTAETDAFIPDRIGNVDLTCACMTHDDAYSNPDVTKAEADLAFFGDVYRAAREGGATRLESLLLGGIYYAAVFYFGGPSWLEAQQGELQLA